MSIGDAVPEVQRSVRDLSLCETAPSPARSARSPDALSFLAIAENVSDLCYRLDLRPSRRFDYVSPAALDVTGFPPDAFYRDPDLALARVHPDDRDVLDRLRAGGLDGQATRFRFERACAVDGQRWVWLEERATRIPGPDGRPEALVGIVRDVTTQFETERALASALDSERRALEKFRTFERIRDAFVTSVSHELRTPTTSILGFSWILSERGASLESDDVQLFGARIAANAVRLGRLLEDLLELHAIETEVRQVPLARVDLARLLRTEVHARNWFPGRVILELQPAVVEGSSSRLSRLVRALFDNIERHAGPDAQVWISSETTGADVRVVVEDDGPGVPPTLMTAAFEPFIHGQAAAQSAQPGLGIGLTLVHGYAALHGGVTSLGRGRRGGARVEVSLPRASSGP